MRRKAVLTTGKSKVEKKLDTVRNCAEIKGLNKPPIRRCRISAAEHKTKPANFFTSITPEPL